MICRRGTESMTACSDPRAGRKRERKGEQSFRPARGFRLPWQKDMGERPYENLQELQRRQKSGEEGVVARDVRRAQRLRGSREGTDTPRRLPGCIGRGKALRGEQEISSLRCSWGRAFSPSRSREDFCGDLRPGERKPVFPRFSAFKRISKRRSIGRRRTHVTSP